MYIGIYGPHDPDSTGEHSYSKLLYKECRDTVGPLYYKPLKCGNLCNKDTILCPSVVLWCI